MHGAYRTIISTVSVKTFHYFWVHPHFLAISQRPLVRIVFSTTVHEKSWARFRLSTWQLYINDLVETCSLRTVATFVVDCEVISDGWRWLDAGRCINSPQCPQCRLALNAAITTLLDLGIIIRFYGLHIDQTVTIGRATSGPTCHRGRHTIFGTCDGDQFVVFASQIIKVGAIAFCLFKGCKKGRERLKLRQISQFNIAQNPAKIATSHQVSITKIHNKHAYLLIHHKM